MAVGIDKALWIWTDEVESVFDQLNVFDGLDRGKVTVDRRPVREDGSNVAKSKKGHCGFMLML